MDETRYSIGELAQRAGITRRTVRFYVQRGLIPLPLGRGRGEHYTDGHLTAVLRVKSLQEQGASLEEIRRHAAGEPGTAGEAAGPVESVREATKKRKGAPEDETVVAGPPKPTAWWDTRALDEFHLRSRQFPLCPGQVWVRQVVMPGLELHAQGAEHALTERQLAALAQFINQLRDQGGNDES